MNIIVTYRVPRNQRSVVYREILFCSPLDTHCVCVPVGMYVTHSVAASKRVEATCSALHEGANKACNSVCRSEYYARCTWC
jgi:hypothetical protein